MIIRIFVGMGGVSRDWYHQSSPREPYPSDPARSNEKKEQKAKSVNGHYSARARERGDLRLK
jgi:hypothetical protein